MISRATVISIKEYNSTIREYSLQLERNSYFEAGSFLQLSLDKDKDHVRWSDSRNFSIASAYNKDGIIKLIIKKIGSYTSRIFEELLTGEACLVKYAFGDFLLPFYDNKGIICCIAGGTGIAPILSFCESLSQKQEESRLHIFYSFKNREECVGLDVLTASVRKEQLHLFCTGEQYEDVTNRRIDMRDICDTQIDIYSSHFYICGKESFSKHFRIELSECGAKNIYSDEW